MIKISNREIIDVVKYSPTKAIIVEKKPLSALGQYTLSCFVLNFENGDKEVITKNAYLMKKFGSSFDKITDKIANYAECDSAILSNRDVLLVFPNGQLGMFNSDGELKWNNELSYNEKVVNGLAPDGEYFWSCCKDENCVIRYNAENINVDIRVGSKDAETFIRPNFVSADDEFIYVCCNGSKVRKIDKSNFTVSDVKEYADLKKFFKHNEFSIICTSGGCYIDKD